MQYRDILLLALVILVACIFNTVSGLKCYECNVWKAGYGHLCDNPRIREGCTVCMKIETNVWVGYYKSSPRHSVISSKVCSKDKTVRFSHECHVYTASDGQSKRCFCDTDLCNGAPSTRTVTLTLPLALSSGVLLLRKWLL